MEDPQILEVTLCSMVRSLNCVVRAAEHQRREHLVAVDVPREAAGLSNQRPNDVSVVNAALVSATQTLAAELQLVREPDLDAVLEQSNAHRLLDESRGHRVRVVSDADGAPLGDGHVLLGELRQPRDDERPHRRELIGDTASAALVGLAQRELHEFLPSADALEVAMASNEQRLLESTLDGPVARLDISILLLCADGCRPCGHPEVPHQREVLLVERPLPAVRLHALAIRNAVRRRGRVVGLVEGRHAAELKQGRLHAAPKRGQRLAQADRRPLPIRERQRENAQHVNEQRAHDGDAERRRPREVHLARLARTVLLREHDLAVRPVLRAPLAHVPLQRPKLPGLVAPGVALLEHLEDGLRLELGRRLKKRDDLSPVLRKRVLARPPGPGRHHLRR